MNNNATFNLDAPRKKREYSDEEYTSALDFASFLYDLWRKRNENAIMESDKTFYDNEAPSAN